MRPLVRHASHAINLFHQRKLELSLHLGGALKQLEEENRKLKQLVADLSLDKVMLQDVLKKKL